IPTLRYLQKGGRVSLAKTLIASIFSIHPILGVVNGLVEVVAKPRTLPKALQEIIVLLEEKYDFSTPVALMLVHADAEEASVQLGRLVKEKFNVQLELTTELSAALVVHSGPGAVGAMLIPLKLVEDLV
ncbi:MAG: DegV family protein, partial [bacterium]|nr:DegV family protein [bacterium]